MTKLFQLTDAELGYVIKQVASQVASPEDMAMFKSPRAVLITTAMAVLADEMLSGNDDFARLWLSSFSIRGVEMGAWECTMRRVGPWRLMWLGWLTRLQGAFSGWSRLTPAQQAWRKSQDLGAGDGMTVDPMGRHE